VRPEPYAWTVHPEATAAIALLVVAYVLARRGHTVPRWRTACFVLGVALLLVTAVTPLEALSYHLLSAHLLQNVVLAEWAPALLVLGLAPSLARALARARVIRELTRPVVALPLWLATYLLWHLPPAYDAALEHSGTLLHLEHALYLTTGVLMWWPVVHDAPHRLASGARGAYVFAGFVLAAPLGLMLALLPRPVYAYYEDASMWGLTPHGDQQLAGVTMAAEQSLVFFAAFAFFFARFLREQDAG